uniref:Thioredoxin-like_fold domain-containing protein n=1 Tax=Ascaris lumbricoides TaxID=6252 RepID=A0A0M3I339_ASCLU
MLCEMKQVSCGTSTRMKTVGAFVRTPVLSLYDHFGVRSVPDVLLAVCVLLGQQSASLVAVAAEQFRRKVAIWSLTLQPR